RLHAFDEQCAFVGEVPVDAALGASRSLRDGPRGGGGESPLGDDLARGTDDLLSDAFSLLRAGHLRPRRWFPAGSEGAPGRHGCGRTPPTRPTRGRRRPRPPTTPRGSRA